MLWKFSLAVLLCFLSVQVSRGSEQINAAPKIHVGDSVLLELTGEPAISVLRLQSSNSYSTVKDGNVDFCLPLEGKVVAVKDSGEVVVQSQSEPTWLANDPRIVTISVRIDRSRIEPASPHGPSSPHSEEAPSELERQVREIQARQERLPRVQLDSMEGIRLCAWEMVEEVGK